MNKPTLPLLFAFLVGVATATAQDANITFRVDMSKLASPDITGAHFAGTPNNWVPQPMTALGGGRFELTLSVPQGSNIEYKFLDGPNNFEPAAGILACGTPNGNRSLAVGTDDLVLPKTCFGTCDVCQSTVKVSVNMSSAGSIDPAGVYAATASGDVPMTDGGNGIWTATLPTPTFSTLKYRFKNGPATEPTADLTACGLADGSGGFWRTATVAITDLTAPTVCFGRCGGCPLPCATDPDMVICDDFNGYAPGPIGPQSAHWAGFGGADGGPEDPSVTAAQSSDGGLSLKISGDDTGGATPNVTVLRLGNLATGKFDLRWKMRFPAGKTAFFNIVHDEIGAVPALTAIVSPSGHVFLSGPNGQSVGQFDVPNDAWVDVQLIADLDGGAAQVRMGSVFSQNMAFGGALGGVNFSGIAPNVEFFVDQVEFRKNALFALNIDDCPSAFDLSPALNGPAPTVSTMLFDNTGATAEPNPMGVDCFSELLYGGTERVQDDLWFRFEGNGRTYQIQTAPCGAGAAYIDDTQMAAYTGADCASLIPLGCNDDIGYQYTGDFRSGLVISAETGKSYRLLVDGFEGAAGKFCLQFTKFQRVTFQVDASQIAAGSFAGMLIAGSWDGWSMQHPMDSIGNKVYSYSVDLPPGAIIEWKYLNGPGGWEPDASLSACGKPNGLGGFNRVVTISTDVVLGKTCFGSCDTCQVIGWYDDCAFAENISAYFGKGPGIVSTTPTFSTENATASATDPTTGFDCFLDQNGPELTRSTYFKFTGDGKYYRISTVPCNAVNYVTDGDTQMAVYEGTGCQFGQSVACNDDLVGRGDPDFRSGVFLQTTVGQPYIILIDGYDDAHGEFCIEVVETAPIGCAQAMLGEPEATELNICDGQTSTLLLDQTMTVAPNVGPVAGFSWIVSGSPVPAGWDESPVGLTDYVLNFGATFNYFDAAFPNIGFLPYGTYYFTPVTYSGASFQPGSGDGLDLAGGCWEYGQPVKVTLVPMLDPLSASSSATPETQPGSNGAITLNISGGSDAYLGEWSNGATGEALTGLKAGNYTVTVTDATGCTDPLVLTINVPDFTIATHEIPRVSAISVMPNPTSGPVHFSVQMLENQEVAIQLVNSLGQVIAAQKFAEGEKAEGFFELSGQPAGVYSLRFEIGGRTAARRVVLID